MDYNRLRCQYNVITIKIGNTENLKNFIRRGRLLLHSMQWWRDIQNH